MNEGADMPTDPGQGPAAPMRRKVHMDPESGRVEGVITLWGVSIPAQFAVDLARSFGVNTPASARSSVPSATCDPRSPRCAVDFERGAKRPDRSTAP